jgi:hypothetical protein
LVHLIGIGHTYQLRAVKPFRDGGLDNVAWSQIACQLEGYLNEIVDQLKPQATGEEYSQTQLDDACLSDDQAYLVVQRVCTRRGVKHVFCDPDQPERAALYKAHCTTEPEDERNGWPIREGEWLRRLLPHASNGAMLFVCGVNHIRTFPQRLATADIEASVVCENFAEMIGVK